MREPPLPSPWNRPPLALLYVVVLLVTIAVLRLLGHGWIGAITAGLVLGGIVWTLLVLLGSTRHRR